MSPLEVIRLPQVWSVGFVVLLLGVLSYKRRKSPSVDDFVELVAYCGALWGVRVVFGEAIRPGIAVDVGIAQMAGAVLLAFVACRGAWRIITRAEVVAPTRGKSEPPPAPARDKSEPPAP